MSKTYQVNEIFYSLQGEGMRAGCPSVFVRFSGCNLKCDLKEGPLSPGGFACDTEFASGRHLTLEEIHEWVEKCSPHCKWLVLTGGEPMLQVDEEFCVFFHALGYMLAVETNGTRPIPMRFSRNWAPIDGTDIEAVAEEGEKSNEGGVDWITLSPKVAEHAIKVEFAHEVKYVRGYGQGIPRPRVDSHYRLISPAFEGGIVPKETLDWCIKLCLENPQWRLSVQQHKQWAVR